MSIDSTIRSAWRAARAEFAGSTLERTFQLGVKAAVSAGFAGLVAFSPANAQEGKFYERIGGKVYEINANAAQGLTPDHWELYLFNRGTTPSSDPAAPGHWGSDTDKDLDKLMESNRKAIAFDHKFERWCGCDGGDLVNDNYFGPIAIMEDENSNRNSVANRFIRIVVPWKDKIDALKEKVDQAQDLWNFLLSATGARSAEQQLDDLQEKVKLLDPSAVKGYVQNLKLGLSGYAGVQAVLEGAGAQAGNINLLLDNAAQELDAAQASGLRIKQALNTPSTNVNTYSWNVTAINRDEDAAKDQKVVLGAQLQVQTTYRSLDNPPEHAPFSDSCVAPPLVSTAKFSPVTDDSNYQWEVVIQCDSNLPCISSTTREQKHFKITYASLDFPTQNDANDFIAKFNAQKAALSNPQSQPAAPAPPASPAPQASPARPTPRAHFGSPQIQDGNPVSPFFRSLLDKMGSPEDPRVLEFRRSLEERKAPGSGAPQP
jgi:hypothetical protein